MKIFPTTPEHEQYLPPEVLRRYHEVDGATAWANQAIRGSYAPETMPAQMAAGTVNIEDARANRALQQTAMNPLFDVSGDMAADARNDVERALDREEDYDVPQAA